MFGMKLKTRKGIRGSGWNNAAYGKAVIICLTNKTYTDFQKGLKKHDPNKEVFR